MGGVCRVHSSSFSAIRHFSQPRSLFMPGSPPQPCANRVVRTLWSRALLARSAFSRYLGDVHDTKGDGGRRAMRLKKSLPNQYFSWCVTWKQAGKGERGCAGMVSCSRHAPSISPLASVWLPRHARRRSSLPPSRMAGGCPRCRHVGAGWVGGCGCVFRAVPVSWGSGLSVLECVLDCEVAWYV